MRQRIAVVIGCFVALSAAAACADSAQFAKWSEERPDGAISLNLGAISPKSTMDLSKVPGLALGRASTGDMGFIGSIQYLNRFWPTVSLGGELGYYETGEAKTSFPAGLISSRYHGALFMGDVEFRPKVSGSASPYILGAAGFAHTALQVGTSDVAGTNRQLSFPSNGADGFASWLRAGVDFRLNDTTSFGVEGGWLHLEKRRYDVLVPLPSGFVTRTTLDVGLENVTVMATLRYFF